jgi:group I intron endonuclease
MKNKLYTNLGLAKLKHQINKKAGIYQLVNLKNNKTYIGSSNNLYIRLKFYINPLGLNKILKKQKSYISKAILKYGNINFGIKILEFIEFNSNLTKLEQRKAILDREQHYLSNRNITF